MKTHQIKFTHHPQTLSLDWDGPGWRECQALAIDQFHPRSTDHRPITHAKLLATSDSLSVLFRVQDRYVKSVATKLHDMVARDSCVELFWQPLATKGYFNFEFNCGGVMLLYYIEDPKRQGEAAFDKYAIVDESHASKIEILTTLPKVNPVEITEPIEWRLAAKIPFNALKPYIGNLQLTPGQRTKGNLYKCGSLTSKPHWAAWSSVGEELNFHLPGKFGELMVG